MTDKNIATLKKEFNESIKWIIEFILKWSKSEQMNAQIDRLTRRLSLVRSTVADYELFLISTATPFFIKYSNHIDEKADKFFLGINIKKEIIDSGLKIEREDEFIIELVESAKNIYKSIPKFNKDELFNRIVKMHDNCIDYKILITPD